VQSPFTEETREVTSPVSSVIEPGGGEVDEGDPPSAPDHQSSTVFI
jgi:hypothetical protein